MGRVWQEQEKLEPPPAVLEEEGWFMPTINKWAAGVASHAPPSKGLLVWL